jgi:hypothetical protein
MFRVPVRSEVFSFSFFMHEKKRNEKKLMLIEAKRICSDQLLLLAYHRRH